MAIFVIFVFVSENKYDDDDDNCQQDIKINVFISIIIALLFPNSRFVLY